MSNSPENVDQVAVIAANEENLGLTTKEARDDMRQKLVSSVGEERKKIIEEELDKRGLTDENRRLANNYLTGLAIDALPKFKKTS